MDGGNRVTGFGPWVQGRNHQGALAPDEDDGPPIDLGRAQGSQPEQNLVEKMVLDQSASKVEDSKGQGSITCELCGACFETRKGLSSHARSHLRQLGIPGSETTGAAVDLLKELIKQGKFSKDESALGAKKVGSTQQETPKALWGDEDGPLNLSVEGEPNRENACQFCGAWFETRKGLASHARAHLRQWGVNDPDSKGSAIVALNAHIKKEEFKKRMSGQTAVDKELLTKAPSISTDTECNSSSKSKETATFIKPTESTNKASSDGSANPSEGGSCSVKAEGGLKLADSAGPIETSAHFKSPSGSGNGTQIKIVEAGAPRVVSPEANAYSKLAEAGSSPVKTEAGRGHGKMGPGNQSKPSIGGLARPRMPLAGTPPMKKIKMSFASCKSNLDSFWAQKNAPTPLNLSSQSDPTRDIRCEFCNEFFENRKGLSSHARSHLRQMGVTEWHVNGSPIDTLREIMRKRRPTTPQQQLPNIKKEPLGEEEPSSPSHRLSPLGVGASMMIRDFSMSPPGRPHNRFLSPLPTKRPASHEPRMTQSEPKGFMNAESKTCSPAKSYIQGESRPKSYITEDGRPKSFVHADSKPKHFLLSGEGRPKTFMHEGRPKGFLPSENRPKVFIHSDGKTKVYLQGDGKPKSFMPGENKPKFFLQGESKPRSFSPDGKPKAYIQTELPFKVKVKASPEKAVTSMEAACELCGLIFENRKALASHARAHLRQFGVTEWCVNGSPIETLREWMKQRPQKAGAYLSYIQGRPFSKKFKRALQIPKPGPEKQSPVTTPTKVTEKEHSAATPSSTAEKPAEPQGQKVERRHPKPPEVPPSQEDTVSEPLPKNEEPRPPARARPVPSLVPRPPQTSLVKFVGNIYTLKCRFCDIQFQGPLSIQEQWVRHLQNHILEMNFSKILSPPHDVSSQEQSEAVKSQ
ncbi:protein Wiz-like isoform 3-T3 [Mantella aurantiaca]